MKRPLFGSRLYGQIVYPLLAASIAVGIIATLVAVFFLSDLTDRWVEQVAEGNTGNIVLRQVEYARQMSRVARLAGTSQPLVEALESGDLDALRAAVATENEALQYDTVCVLDENGEVLAHDGHLVMEAGGQPFGKAAIRTARPTVILSQMGDHHGIVALQPMDVGGEQYTLALGKTIDKQFLSQMGVSKDSAFCFYTTSGQWVACAKGEGFSPRMQAQLDTVTSNPGPELGNVLARARQGGTAAGTMPVGDQRFEIWAQRLSLPGATRIEDSAYVVGLVSQDVTRQAGRTTTNLIMMWSIVAVVALVGLGGWVARRVSDPLVELSAGARRVAEGDFETKVDVGGANEISELATTFNQMTDSLRDRSESLTKKVLELASLYEMSRSLGSTLDLDELLGSVLDSALRIFDLDLGYVGLRSKETGAIEIRSVRGAPGSASDGAVRSSMSEWVVREGRPLIFNPDAGAGEPRVDTVTGARAALCVPLISSEGSIGAVTIGSSDPEYRFDSDDVRLLSTIANHVTIAVGNIELFTSLQEAYLATVRSLAAAVDAKDSYTRGHSERVATFATLIAERMGLSHEQRIALEMAAYLHDIGKIGVREDILLKPGRLDDGEMAQMRHHPLIGANILKPVAFPWAITPVVRHHHEHFDGSGYPAGLRGDEIPLLARILTVADSYEAMTSDRPYRKGMSTPQALDELHRCAGAQFDPRIVEVFAGIVAEFEQSGDTMTGDPVEDVSAEEARAIFAALVDGVFGSFRRLGGPRLANNVEREADAYFEESTMPFRVSSGRVAFIEDPPEIADGELDQMRMALRRIDTIMARLSGTTLVDHFYTDAFRDFSGRMRHLARALGFYQGE